MLIVVYYYKDDGKKKMENTKVKHYLSSCYLLTKPKLDLKRIFDAKGFVSSFVRENYGREKVNKTYYDAQGFFQSHGVNISIVRSSSLKKPQLVIRLESKIQRLQFLQEMPEKFVKEIGEKDSIAKYQQYITECVMDIYPNGLNTDVSVYVAQLKPFMVVSKNQEKIRMINNAGLKYFIYYGKVEYHNILNGVKEKQDQLELVLDYANPLEKFHDLVHRVEVQVPSILKLNSSDIMNAITYTRIAK